MGKKRPLDLPDDKQGESKKVGPSRSANLDFEREQENYFWKNHFKEGFANAFQSKSAFTDVKNNALVSNEPFLHCVLPNFLKSNEFLENLRDELLDLIFFDKNNDLFKFNQSDDLKTTKTPCVSALRRYLYQDVLSWLKDVTGVPLNDTVDMNCARYDHTDILLCHDDELEGRRIAYILYLVPAWAEENGGMLDLFNTDVNGQPDKVVKSLLPAWGNFVFFEVSPVSFHQVAEVLTEDRTRMSISGWFHGPPIQRPPRYTDQVPLPISPCFVEEDMFLDWVNPTYLDAKIQMKIRRKFQKNSEIELKDFLKDEKYKVLSELLQNTDLQWEMRGPANIRHYEICSNATLPSLVQDCLKVLKSEAMFLTLSNLTGLKLHELAAVTSDEDSTSEEEVDGEGKTANGVGSSGQPHCFQELRRWKHGAYTLVYDDRQDVSEYALDAMLYFNCTNYQNDFGGYTSYITKGEDEELLTVNPMENSLALVYRDRETVNFVKHVNHKITRNEPHSQFYDISVVYHE